jgi:hypothetical protein
MKTRPTSVTVIAWVLMIAGGISLLTSMRTMNNPLVREIMSRSLLPVSVQLSQMYAGLLISIVCGIGMLNGKNWARFLYVGWSVLGFLVGITTSPMKGAMLPGLVLFVIIAIFLFRPAANEYFTEKKEAGGTSAQGS